MDLLAWRMQVPEYISQGLNGFAAVVINYPGAVFAGTVGILGSLAVVGAIRHIRSKSRGEDDMARRRVLLDEKYADMIGDGLFEMLLKDDIDRHEYKKACRRFGIAYHLSDLLVAKNKQRGMKSRIKNNIRMTKLLDASGDPIQPRIPGPKPAEVVPVPQMKQAKAPKRWIAKGKSLQRPQAA